MWKWISKLLGRRKDAPDPPPELEPMPDVEPAELGEMDQPENLTLEELGIEIADLPELVLPTPPGILQPPTAEAYDAAIYPERTVADLEVELRQHLDEPELLTDDVVAVGEFRAVITSPGIPTGVETANGTACQWRYACMHARLKSIDYTINDWETYGVAFLAYNTVEWLNAGSEVCHGLPKTLLDYDSDEEDEFYLRPIPVGTPITVKVDMLDGQPKYSFSEPNAIAGGC